MVNLVWIFRFGKNSEGYCLENWNINTIKCKRSILEVLGCWIWVLKITKGFSGSFPHVGEDDL